MPIDVQGHKERRPHPVATIITREKMQRNIVNLPESNSVGEADERIGVVNQPGPLQHLRHRLHHNWTAVLLSVGDHLRMLALL